MPNSDLIRGGTVSVAQGSTSVTGQGVSWSNVLEGDLFGVHVGLAVPILSVSGATITLAYPWPGPTQNAAPYAIQPKGDTVRFGQDVRDLLTRLSDGDLAAIAALNSAADTIPYFTGPGAAALAAFKQAGRDFLNDNFYPVQQGGGQGQSGNKLRLGWASSPKFGIKAQVDADDKGYIWTDVDAPNSLSGTVGFQRLPNGLILQWGAAVGSAGPLVITFPIAFPHYHFSTLVEPYGNIASNSLTATYEGISLSQMRIYRRHVQNGGAVVEGFFEARWLALGS